MGDCHCSNITIMQLFHELKQQFPALPDHVVSQCIAQNSHDREICARSLRATQDSRPSPGAFPPPGPESSPGQQRRGLSNGARSRSIPSPHSHSRVHRPISLDIGPIRQCSSLTTSRCCVLPPLPPIISTIPTRPAPSSAPATYSTRGFFDDSPVAVSSPLENYSGLRNIKSSGFEVNVNVACSSAGNRDFRSGQSPCASKRSDLIIEPSDNDTPNSDHTRSYTSVSLTLRPPSSEPQAPIDIRSQGSSLTYSTSSLDPRGFQSRLQISIGPGNVGSVAAARIRPSMGHPRPQTLIPTVPCGHQRPPGLPAGPPSQLPRPTTTMSAPTTPSAPVGGLVTPSSLPTTPSAAQAGPGSTFTPPSSPAVDSGDWNRSPFSHVADHQKQLIRDQLIRKERLAKELRAEKGRLAAMKKEIAALESPTDPLSPQELKKKLRSDIYQLQVECDRLADEVDQRSETAVPLGETNEEFYQGIYTGQPLNLPAFADSTIPPPLPSMPPAWQPYRNQRDDDQDDKDGPSWVCEMCTFDNHPLMDQCEQCDMPRFPPLDTGETQDIHIRVTHHHNFSPRRTMHSWVV